jgi:hypothetical protein
MPTDVQPNAPPPVTLFGRYISLRPLDMPRDSIGNPVPAALLNLHPQLGQKGMAQLIRLMEDTAPSIVASAFSPTGQPTPQGRDILASLVIDRLDKEWADLRFRRPGGGNGFLRLANEMAQLELDAELLDVAGAWLDSYARIPNVRWLDEKEREFCSGLDEILANTSYARRAREIVRRSDVGSVPVIERPLNRFLLGRPDLAHIDAKLREAQEELDRGHPADAITDIAVALQQLFSEMGFDGKTLGEQVTAARQGGTFSGLDAKIGLATENLCDWVAAIRNQRSDSHPASPVDPADAEFAYRIVAALVLRFAGQ